MAWNKKRKQTPTQVLSELLAGGRRERLLFLLVNEAHPSETDTSMLAVFDEQPPAGNLRAGGLELRSLRLDRARFLLHHRDPIVTEPLLVGNLVHGDAELAAQFRAELVNSKVRRRQISHLFGSGLANYQDATNSFDCDEPGGILRGLADLDRAVRYLGLAVCYSANPDLEPLTLAQLHEQLPTALRHIWHACRTLRMAKAPPRGEALAQLAKLEQLVLSGLAGRT